MGISNHRSTGICPSTGKPFSWLWISIAMCAFATAAWGEDEPAEPQEPLTAVDQLLGAIPGGKIILDVNLRWEYGKIDQFQHSHSATVRTRFGFETLEVFGFTGLIEGVNTTSPKPSAYYDGVGANNGPKTIVSDPERTDVNRIWLQFKKDEWAGLKLKTGRQRIVFDDARWVGNVAWRQNEQTFDSAVFQTDFGSDKILAQYVYAWQVKRIWADKGAADRRDFGPRSHFINVAYDHSKAIKAVGFIYLIDPNENDPIVREYGSATFGFRLTGSVPMNEDLSFPYQASYAYQEDFGNNPVSYGAHYYLLQGGVKVSGLGTIQGGFEVLGSDRDARIITPFSTAHKFNGFADAFLNNGLTRGLRDLYAVISPEIPIKGVKLDVFFHQFWDDQGGDDLGQEYDFVTSYKLNEHVSFLYKFAYFDGGKRPEFSNTTRSILQTTFTF